MPPSYPDTRPSYDDDVKAPYDDLIDQYATPYSQYTSRPDPTSVSSHRPTPSYPLSFQPTRTSESVAKLPERAATPPEWAYPPSPPIQEKPSKRWWQEVVPDSMACRLYLLTVLIETAIDLAIEADLFILVQKENGSSDGIASRKMPVYLTIFALAHVFQFGMAVDAVYARNTLQFIFLAIFNALFLLYAVIQISEIRELAPNASQFSHVPIDVLTTVIPIVISVAQLAYIGLGWKIYMEFGWKVYKFLGADRRIKTMYAHHQIFLCLVKFDFFFWVGFSVQFIWLVLNGKNVEYYLTCAALPLSIIVLIEGHLAARHENKWMMATFMTGCAGAMVYFMYKLVKVLRFKDTDAFVLVWKTLVTFSAFAILLLLATGIIAILVMNNFGRGLKKQISNNTNGGLQRGKTQVVHRGPMSTHPNRMSIE